MKIKDQQVLIAGTAYEDNEQFSQYFFAGLAVVTGLLGIVFFPLWIVTVISGFLAYGMSKVRAQKKAKKGAKK